MDNPPYFPTIVVPRVLATTTAEEVQEQIKPKAEKDWSQEERDKHDLAGKCKRLLIMAIPYDIFKLLDSCDTSKDLCSELQRQIECGAKQLRNNKALCINEYFPQKREKYFK